MLKIKDELDIEKIVKEYNFEHAFVHNTNLYILKGNVIKAGKTKQQEFVSIHKDLRVIECYGVEILSVIYDMTIKGYLEDVKKN